MLGMAGEISGKYVLRYKEGLSETAINIYYNFGVSNQSRVCFKASWLYLVTSGIALVRHRCHARFRGWGFGERGGCVNQLS